ncbi:hypothetical protein RN001_005033 [Aquatica leii]|uniref:Chitin-binding type-2 domain-containing protein n=1 Tax=Aquatica leii TaxID=1421715 RepID=A0AAN7SIJ8_9COLE|nr:hypothetical protein RN001_005033 [Aquatica leii]
MTLIIQFQLFVKCVPSCPEDGSHANTTILPDEECCNQYYICSNGNPILSNCSIGLHFNPVLQVCDWPENARCASNKVC